MKIKIEKNKQKELFQSIEERYKDTLDRTDKLCQALYQDLCQQEVAFRVDREEELIDYVMKYLHLHQLQYQVQEMQIGRASCRERV